MKITAFFRLPIVSFIATFAILFLQLVDKLNSIGEQAINYHYSPDFMRILGLSLLMLLITSICLNRIKLYLLTIRNIIFIIVTVSLALLLGYWSEMYLFDLFAHSVDLDNVNGYKIFVFWYPVASRLVMILLLFLTVALISYLVKNYLNWADEKINFNLIDNDTAKKIQIMYLTIGYLAVNFIFQRYLYIAVYLFSGGGDLPEFHNFSFYLSAIMTAILLVMFLSRKQGYNYRIDAKTVINVISRIVLSQLVISVIISLLTIYVVQWYFVTTQPTGEIDRYTHYISLLYAMLNSIFVVSILTCLASYFAGRFWLKKYHYLAKTAS
ncbi:hypothetical protein RHO14_06555 [Orbus wheelerorum]|uniref:hypothetical protein n=1 Tax=Orbus wheelerorum TaxID=3074111 RepID=UPI00370DA2E8